MNTALWIIQVLLALVFGLTGFAKIFVPREKLQTRLQFVKEFSPSQVRLIGTLEVLGALGVVLPLFTGILPILTPLAAAGLILTMVGAGLYNVRHSAYSHIVANAVLAALAVVVVYGRLVALPVV